MVKKITRKPTSHYSRFFKVMLILSTIGTSLSALGGIVSLPQLNSTFTTSLVYGIVTVIGYFTVTLAALGVWFLWKRHYIGLVYKLLAYCVTITTSTIMLAFDNPIIDAAALKTREQLAQSGKIVNDSLIHATVSFVFTATYIFAILGGIVFSILWWQAWKSQQKYEAK